MSRKHLLVLHGGIRPGVEVTGNFTIKNGDVLFTLCPLWLEQ